jgi:uncharacterized metal-binding protein YceD (DUF177 family)
MFDLRDALARPLSGLRYELHASLSDGQVILNGRLEADFELTCGKTTEKFPQTVELAPYFETIELENSDSIDLTEQLREDILLALPAYPRAPGADESDTLPEVESADSTSGEESRRSEWDALDGLKTND